jgi:hypothetical protein
MSVLACNGFYYAHGLSYDFGADAVAGKECDVEIHYQVSIYVEVKM